MSVTITTPTAGATLSGTVPVKATFSGPNFDIATLVVDGTQVGSDAAQPIEFLLDTTKLTNAAHTIRVAVRYRTAGGRLRWQKAEIQATVNNAPSSDTWVRVAIEHAPFTLGSTAEVRYGSGSTWVSGVLAAGTYSCDNNLFGDPLPGTVKECQVRQGAEPPPPPPPPSDWPASYFTGPLGSRNPVPPKGKVFLIEMYGGIGTTYKPEGWAQMLQREADIGRKFDGLHYILDRSYDMPGDIIAHGSLPCFTWMPGSPAQVNAGALDSAIDSMADYLKSYAPHVIIVRLFREFDIPFLAEHACGSEFISAWRRVVDRFQARGADNVGWWWTPTEGTDRACINASWPGDDYVDWSGVDQYNMYLDGQVSPLHPGWAEFWEIVHYGTNCQHDIWGPRKPFVIGETSTHPDLQNPPHKGDWWRNIPKAIRGEQGNQGPMEWLCGISFYDCDVRAAEGPNANYRVDWPTNVPEIYAGWLAMCADPVWNRGGIV